MSKQTKIVATVSDKRCDVEFVRDLFENGMNVVRMNSAHLDAEGFNKIITNVRAVSNTIAILMDTKGPGDADHSNCRRRTHQLFDWRLCKNEW